MTMNFAKIVALSCFCLNVLIASGPAQAQQNYPQPFNPDPYFQWCDQVELRLSIALNEASGLYKQFKFDQSKKRLVKAFEEIQDNQLPGTFRPNAHREVLRSLELIKELEASQTPASNLKSKMLAYVAINRASFVLSVKNRLDRPYVIPYGPYGYQLSYGIPADDLYQYETTLADIASKQLLDAQNYSTLTRYTFPSVVPMVNAETYFIIVGKAAKWAAEDLSNLLFGNAFACGILQLQTLGEEATALSEHFGDLASVQIIYQRVNFLARMLNSRPYCHR